MLMKKTIFFSFIIFFIFTLNLSAQYNRRYQKQYKEAKIYINNENYFSALRIFEKLHKKSPNNSNIKFYLGLCYYKTQPKTNLAYEYLESIKSSISIQHNDRFDEESAPIQTYFILGKAYQYNSEFDKALENYNLYMSSLKKSDRVEIKKTENQIKQIETAIYHYSNPSPVRLINLGDVVNSEYPDFAPVISHDDSYLIFTSRRPSRKTGRKKDHTGHYFEDIYISDHDKNTKEFSNLRKIEGKINTKRHEASVSLSWDGKTLFIYKDEFGIGNVYMSIYEDGKWSNPIELAPPINSRNNEKHAFLSSDGSWLYFVSDRPGGYGGKDIYRSKRLAFNRWSTPENLGPNINTPYDEDGPVLIYDDKTLYFSSQGHESMGGYDVFVSRLIDGEWSKPKNIGHPINTTADDVFFVPTLKGDQAYIATDRPGGFGHLDIYRLELEDPLELRAIISGHVKDISSDKGVIAEIALKNLTTGKIVEILKTNQNTGEYEFTVSTGSKYEVILIGEDFTSNHILDVQMKESIRKSNYKQNYWLLPFHSIDPDTFKVNFLLESEEALIAEKYALRNIFFDFDKYNLREESIAELNRIIEFLKLNPELIIEVNGHTDIIGGKNYNKILSENRAMAVVNYFVNNGIEPNRIAYNAYWYSTPAAPNITDQGRQINRRVEHRIVGKGSYSNFTYNLKTDVSNDKEYKYTDKTFGSVDLYSKSKFSVIGGSFNYYENANVALETFKKLGFVNASIIRDNKVKYYRITLKTFKTKEEALIELQKLKNQAKQEDLWILEH